MGEMKKTAGTLGDRLNRHLTPLFAAVVLVLSVLVYLPSLNAFLSCDAYYLVVNPGVRYDPLVGHFTASYMQGAYYRPLTTLSLDLTTRLFGTGPFAHHLVQILLHWAAALALFGIARRLLKSPLWGALAGLIFTLHPLAIHTVLWVGDRSDVLALPLFLFALYGYLRYAGEGGRRWPWLLLAVAGQLLSLFAKETALVIPAVAGLLVWGYLRPRGRRTAGRRSLFVFAVSTGVVLVYLLWRWLVGLSGGPTLYLDYLFWLWVFNMLGWMPLDLLTIPRRVFGYFALLPGAPGIPGVGGLVGFSATLIPAAAFFVLLILAAVRAGKRAEKRKLLSSLSSTPALCVLWLLLTLVLVGYNFCIWYAYLLLPPFAVAAAWLTRRLWRWRRRLTGFALALVLGYYLVATVHAAVQWRKAADISTALTADIVAHRDVIERSGGLVLLSVPRNFVSRGNPLPTAVYNYACLMDCRLREELGPNIEYRPASLTAPPLGDGWDYGARRRDGLLIQESSENTFRPLDVVIDKLEGVGVAPGRVQLVPPDWPVFALRGDEYVLLYDPLQPQTEEN
jgi:hypothetical protein